MVKERSSVVFPEIHSFSKEIWQFLEARTALFLGMAIFMLYSYFSRKIKHPLLPGPRDLSSADSASKWPNFPLRFLRQFPMYMQLHMVRWYFIVVLHRFNNRLFRLKELHERNKTPPISRTQTEKLPIFTLKRVKDRDVRTGKKTDRKRYRKQTIYLMKVASTDW